MKVTLATHGGQGAAIYLSLPPRVVDTRALPKAAAGALTGLVAAAKASPPVTEEAVGSARDAMSYTITIEDGAQPIVLQQSDTNMSDAFRALRDWIKKTAAK